MPDDEILAEAYRRALGVAQINAAIEEAREEAIDKYSKTDMPKSLRRQLLKAMKDSPEAWDKALYRLAQTKVNRETDD